MGPVPKPAKSPPKTGVPKIAINNPAKVSALNMSKRIYRGSMVEYQGWTVILESVLPNGRRNIVVSKGKNVAELQNVRPESIVTKV